MSVPAARFNSLQILTVDLAAAAKFYGEFIGLDLGGEPHRHDGNEALHYDVAWGDFASGEYSGQAEVTCS